MSNDKVIERFRRRLAGIYFLRFFLFCIIFLAFVTGISVLTLRIILEHSLQGPGAVAAVITAILMAILYSVIQTCRIMPSSKTLRVLFDKINQCGGLLMANSEVSIDKWSSLIGDVKAPLISWNGRKQIFISLMATLFLAFSFAVPIRYISTNPVNKFEIEDQARRLEDQIQILEEENVLSAETAYEIRTNLNQIKETAVGQEPVKTWEAMGHIQDQLKKAAEEAVVEIVAKTEELAGAEALAEALKQAGPQLDGQITKDAMEELGQKIDTLLKQNADLQNTISGQLAADAKAGQLSAEQLRELIKALQDQKAEMSKCAGRLCQADLAKMRLMQMCEKAGQCNGEKLAALLAECESAKAAMSYYRNNPNWGIDRGRGDAPMVWADPSSTENTIFKEQVLPPASMAALKDSYLSGVSVSAPSQEEGQENLRPGTLNSVEAQSGQAVKQKILPKHKAVVKEYFYHNETESKQP